LPVTVALTSDAIVTTPAELKEAVSVIAGAAISQRVGNIMDYCHLGEIANTTKSEK
jgi:hypothetical protein